MYFYIQVCTRCWGFTSSCHDTCPLACEVSFHFLPRWWARKRSFPPLDDCRYKGIRAVPIEIRNSSCLQRYIDSCISIFTAPYFILTRNICEVSDPDFNESLLLFSDNWGARDEVTLQCCKCLMFNGK